jgi:hypothetical protein
MQQLSKSLLAVAAYSSLRSRLSRRREEVGAIGKHNEQPKRLLPPLPRG